MIILKQSETNIIMRSKIFLNRKANEGKKNHAKIIIKKKEQSKGKK